MAKADVAPDAPEPAKKKRGEEILRDFSKEGNVFKPGDEIPELTPAERDRLLRLGCIG